MTDFIINLARRQKGDNSDAAIRNRVGTIGGLFGIVSNLFLFIIKFSVGILSGSISIIADGFNNFSDMGSSLITLFGFKLSEKPADSDHPYGHGRMEYMSAFVVSLLIILVGIELFKESATAIINRADMPDYNTFTIIVLSVSVIVKFLMYLVNRSLGKKIKSEALIATAKDSVNDSISTAAILICVVISRFVSLGFNLDAVLGIAVAVFILISGISSVKGTLDSILGGPPDTELIENIKDCIMSFEGFLGIHDLIVHNYGPNRQFASVHVEVPYNSDIAECHERIDLCEKLVKEKLGVELVIHMDPIETDNEETALAKGQMLDIITKINPSLTLHDFRMTPKTENRINLLFDVVVPTSVKIPAEKLQDMIGMAAKEVNPCYVCVITIDNDYLGR